MTAPAQGHATRGGVDQGRHRHAHAAAATGRLDRERLAAETLRERAAALREDGVAERLGMLHAASAVQNPVRYVATRCAEPQRGVLRSGVLQPKVRCATIASCYAETYDAALRRNVPCRAATGRAGCNASYCLPRVVLRRTVLCVATRCTTRSCSRRASTTQRAERAVRLRHPIGGGGSGRRGRERAAGVGAGGGGGRGRRGREQGGDSARLLDTTR
jgi:hypothetical protein